MTGIGRIQDLEELDAAWASAADTETWLFKHSLICPVSDEAWREFNAFVDSRSEAAGTAYKLIEIQRAREVSNAIAERTGIPHESPQAILLRQGRVVWHASHWEITRARLAEAVQESSAAQDRVAAVPS